MFGLVIALQGCKKDGSSSRVSVMNKVSLKLKSPAGADLFAPGTTEQINEGNTTLYYLVGNSKVEYFDQGKDYPKGLFIHNDASTGEYLVEVFLNHDVPDGGVSTNILEYAHYSPDTIQVKIRKAGRSIGYDRLWLNGEEISLTEKRQPDVIIKTRTK